MNFVPIAIALRPRKLIALLPSARAIFAPSPGLSPPSILTQWIVSVFARPASCAARVAFAPLTGLTNRIPLPGCSGVRRAKTSSRSAPALASASSLSAAPPARSTSIADQTSAFVTLSAMVFPLSGMQPANLLSCGRLRQLALLLASRQQPHGRGGLRRRVAARTRRGRPRAGSVLPVSARGRGGHPSPLDRERRRPLPTPMAVLPDTRDLTVRRALQSSP